MLSRRKLRTQSIVWRALLWKSIATSKLACVDRCRCAISDGTCGLAAHRAPFSSDGLIDGLQRGDVALDVEVARDPQVTGFPEDLALTGRQREREKGLRHSDGVFRRHEQSA